MKITLEINRILSVFYLALLLCANIAVSHAGSTITKTNSQNFKSQNLVVVELFTSQGCNSCPPADEILANFSKERDILALSYSVDYWNYLGWKDTLAQPACTMRQKRYNAALGKSGVYTPQMVIQGAHDLVGSRGDLARQMVEAARQRLKDNRSSAPDIAFVSFDNQDGDMIELKISGGNRKNNDAEVATIWVIGYDFEKTVNIRKGELSGQVRTYHNVVQSIKRTGSWMGEEIKLTLSKKDLGSGNYDAYALLLQEGETGPIIGAEKLSLK